MPSLGADMESGTLIEWLVKPGDRVHRGDIVAVVETDKGAIEIEIFEDAVIGELLVVPDTEVAVGTPLARLDGVGERPAAPAAAPTKPAVAPPPPRAVKIEVPAAPPVAPLRPHPCTRNRRRDGRSLRRRGNARVSSASTSTASWGPAT